MSWGRLNRRVCFRGVGFSGCLSLHLLGSLGLSRRAGFSTRLQLGALLTEGLSLNVYANSCLVYQPSLAGPCVNREGGYKCALDKLPGFVYQPKVLAGPC